MRKSAVFSAALLTAAMVLPSEARAATPGALSPASASAACATYFGVTAGPEPLSACQWDMKRIAAGPASYAKATGLGVKVGVIDGGVDLNHIDLAGNLDVALSCSFIFSNTPTADPQEIGNGDCTNKLAVQDLQGHGTHVATTIAGSVNGAGIAGVAPRATIVGLKACTIVGFCFADSVAAALRYAGDQRLDVVNLSLFADPYLYICRNVADQKAILKDLQNAARYAQQRGVVIVAAAGNEAQDLGHPEFDDISPDWPPNTAIVREVRNNCRVAPRRTPGRDHRFGLRHHPTGRLLEYRWPGGRRHRPGRRRRADAWHHLWADSRRVVQHGCDRDLGGPRCGWTGSRGRQRATVGLDQRYLDGVPARRRRGRPDQPSPSRMEPRRGSGGRTSQRHTHRVPCGMAGWGPAAVHRWSVEHDVLWGRDGQRAGGSVALSDRCEGGRVVAHPQRSRWVEKV